MKTHLRILTVTLALVLGAGCISSDRQRADDDTTADVEADAEDTDTLATCEGAGDCDDDDPCTVDTCGDDGACQHALVAGCERCTEPSDCEGQGDSCEEARCDDGYCTYQVADGCRPCDDTTVCADGDACTVESCDGTCHYAELDCDDDDPCTVDACNPLSGCTHDDTCGPPAITLTDDPTLDEGDTLVRVGSFTGPPSETFSATVDWGEGEDPEPLPLEDDGTFALHHLYAEDGAYTLVVRIVDGHERAATAELEVTVANVSPTALFEPIAAIEEGGTLALAGVVSDPGDDIVDVTADWGDGSEVEPVTLDPVGAFALSHRYDDDGVYTLVIAASDDEEVGGGELEVIVANAVPHFVPPSNRVVLEGTPTVMTLPISDPGAADTFTGEVRYGLGAGAEPLVVDGHDLVITLDYPDDGTWPVTITLRDDDGGESVDGFVIAVTNVAPEVLDPGDQQVVEGDPLTVAASFSDPGQDSWTAQVSYGDGTPVASPTVDGLAREVPLTHVWQDDGTFLSFVSVVDDDGGEDAATFMVSVENAPPVPSAGGDATIDEGSVFTRDAVAVDPGAGDVLSGTVRWGAGEAEETLGIDVATRAYHLERGYDDEGSHEVTVTVRDDDGASQSETFTLTVANVPPSIDCGSHAVLAAGGRLERICTFTDPGADSWSGTVDWGDGSAPEPLALDEGGFDIGHTFDAEATYPVVVTIDDGTEAGVTTFDVAVGNAPPLVDAGPAAAVDEGGSLVRTGQIYDSSAGTFTATVDYGEGDGPVELALTPGLAFTLDHAYAEDGVYDVTVAVTDPDDTTGEDVVQVTVANLPPAITAGDDASLAEGGRFERTIVIVDPGVEDTVTATVDYGEGDGAAALPIGANGQAQLDHVFTRDGDHTVTVTAADDDGGSAHASFVVHVANGAPVVSTGGEGEAVEGASFTRDVTFEDAGDDTWVLRVAWGDETTPGEVFDVAPGVAIPLAHVYADDGDYTVTVTVDDGTDAGTESFVVHVANAAPVVDAGDDATLDEGQTFTRSGSVADPGIYDTVSATVDWGDGPQALALNSGGGFTLSRAFADDGVYTVTVAATDGDATGSDTVTLTVGNVAPIVSAGAPLSVSEGAELVRTVSFTDPGADSWTATVDWDDGAGPVAATIGANKTVKLTHTYPEDGVHDVVVAISDGTATGTAHLAVTVTNVAPTVDAGGDVGLSEGGTLSRSGAVTDPGASDTFTATVDYGEGGGQQPLTVTPERTFALSHVYATQGAYTVTVRVTDDDSGVGTDTFLVTVSNTAPVVSPGADTELDEGGLLTRQVSFSDSGADTWTATVDYGDGGGPQVATVDPNAKTVALSHTYLDDGDYEVVVTVSDGVETGQGSFGVSVGNVLPVVAAGDAATVGEGTTWTRSGSFSDPGVLDPHTATVDWGDGSAPASLALTAQGTFSLGHAFADDGVYDVVVTVTDDDGAGGVTVPVTVTNVAPDLPGTLGTVTLDVGEPWSRSVSFTDPGADTWTLLATYGENAPTSTPLSSRTFNILHTYWTPGQYTASFRVTDDDSGTDIVTTVVDVANVAPVVEASDPASVAEGSPVMVTATFSDPGSEAHTATMAWAEGVVASATVDEDGEVVTGTYIYTDEGEHDVLVTVTDAYEAPGTDTAHVVVTNVAPTVDAGGDGATTPLGELVRQGSFTDPGADQWTVTADWGDGSAPENIAYLDDKRFVLSHTYLASGDYTVLVTVNDGDGGTGTATFDVAATVLDCSEVATSGQQWVGGASADPTGWGVADNWNPPGVPGAEDDVYLCAKNVYYPVLSQGTYVHDVHMAPTASIALGSRPLSVSGDLVGGAVTGSGTVTMTGIGATLASDVPGLLVTGDVDATAAVTIGGALTISSDASFGPHDVTVTVRGALTVWSSADGTGLILDGASDVVSVGGAFTAWPGANSGSSPVSTLLGGRLELYGNFTQRGDASSPISFFADGTTVVLVGDADQTVSFQDPGPSRSRFSDLTLPGTHTVALKSNVAVTGVLSVPGSATLVSGKKVMLTSALPVLGPNATYDVATTAIVGAVTMQDDFYLSGATHALGIEGGGVLKVGPHTLDLDGDLFVRIEGSTASGLHMNDDASEISIGGDAELTNTMSNSGAPLLEAGTMWLQGSLRATGNESAAASFAPAGMTAYILDGAGDAPHEVSFVSPTKNRFDTLVLMPGVRVTLLTDVQVAGTLYADNSDRATVTGGTKLFAASLDVAGVDFDQVPLTTSNLVRLTDATFRNQAPADNQLTVIGSTLNVTVRRLRFETLPDSGAYIYGIGTGGGQSVAHLTVEESVPLYGRPWCEVFNGFEITWGSEDDDTDADGLTDAIEHDLGTDPLDDDTDGDTFLDGTEVGVGTSPLSNLEVPFNLRAAVGYAVGTNPSAVAVGDVDGDAALDLAVANEGSDSVTVWFANPDLPGTFEQRVDVQLTVGSAPRGVTIATVRGQPLVLVTETGVDELALVGRPESAELLRSLARLGGLATCDAPNDVALVGPQGGGQVDLAVSCGGADAVRIFTNSFDPTSDSGGWSSSDHAVGAAPNAVIAGDLTGATGLDVATSNGAGTVTVLLGGIYSLYQTIYESGAQGLASGDLTNSGWVEDLIVARSTSDQVSIRYNNGQTGVESPQVFDVGAAPRAIGVADLDGNGWLDIATAATGDDAISVLLQATSEINGKPIYLPHTVAGLDNVGEYDVVLKDLDGDGKVDIIVVARTTGEVVVMRQEPTGVVIGPF